MSRLADIILEFVTDGMINDPLGEPAVPLKGVAYNILC